MIWYTDTHRLYIHKDMLHKRRTCDTDFLSNYILLIMPDVKYISYVFYNLKKKKTPLELADSL